MSWATCYSGSNNTDMSFPPIMSDGRNFTNWNQVPTIDKTVQKKFGITNNYNYRHYLINNGDQIIKYNQLESCDGCGYCPMNQENRLHNKAPVMMGCNNSQNPTNSDLKNLYMSRVQLNNQIFSPHLTQQQMDLAQMILLV